jgi:alpha-beta hydrolase superfamily lysophospholipase
MALNRFAIAALSLAGPLAAQAPKTITFPSTDSLPITADLYGPLPPTAPFIVLFHQAGASRGEYREIAPKLVAMGFNCMAIDQRSGESSKGVRNETAKAADQRHLVVSMLSSRQDLESALRYARGHYARGPLLAWGSSYSAALVLVVAGQDRGIADGVLAFSPGEYFPVAPGNPTLVTDAARAIKVPVFITSARSETADWRAIYAAVSSSLRRAYVPESDGRHGSSALWKETPGQEGYWQAVRGFLNRQFPRSK